MIVPSHRHNVLSSSMRWSLLYVLHRRHVVILCTAHPGQDLSWLADAPHVIDGTYRTPVGSERELL